MVVGAPQFPPPPPPPPPPQVVLGAKVTGLALIINNFEMDKQKLKADIILMDKGQSVRQANDVK